MSCICYTIDYNKIIIVTFTFTFTFEKSATYLRGSTISDKKLKLAISDHGDNCTAACPLFVMNFFFSFIYRSLIFLHRFFTNSSIYIYNNFIIVNIINLFITKNIFIKYFNFRNNFIILLIYWHRFKRI